MTRSGLQAEVISVYRTFLRIAIRRKVLCPGGAIWGAHKHVYNSYFTLWEG